MLKRVKKYHKILVELWNAEDQPAEGDGKGKIKKMIGLLLILTCAGLQLPSHSDVAESLEELLVVADELVKDFMSEDADPKPSKKIHKGSGKATKAVSNDPKAVQVFVDLVISLLTRSSGIDLFRLAIHLVYEGYLREAINRAFASFIEDVDAASIENIVAVIERRDEVTLLRNQLANEYA